MFPPLTFKWWRPGLRAEIQDSLTTKGDKYEKFKEAVEKQVLGEGKFLSLDYILDIKGKKKNNETRK